MAHSIFEDTTTDMQSLTLMAFKVETIKNFLHARNMAYWNHFPSFT